jgi:valyl-tRNA synthetase
MQGIHFMKEVPWKTLYLHGLVRAADGSKMSKSKGNTVDPLGLIDQYGADALRFFMAAMESQGRDIKMDESRVAGYRNFATKLWNAARFAQSNGISGSHSVHAPKTELAVNRWIIGEVVETVEKLNKAFAEFRFDGMADVLYHFVWDQFCDWYLELIKPLVQVRPGEGRGPAVDGAGPQPSLGNADAVEAGPQPTLGNAEADETREVAGWVLDQILVMLHPFMPFITEELWHALADPAQRREYDLIHATWPEPNANVDALAKTEIEWVISLIKDVRAARSELNVPPSARPTMTIYEQSDMVAQYLSRNEAALMRLARVELTIWIGGRDTDVIVERLQNAAVQQGEIAIELEGFGANIELAGVIDLDAERSRITKAIEAATKERDALAGRLSNAAFLEKAKPEAVEKARADHAEKAAEAERLTAALKRLG